MKDDLYAGLALLVVAVIVAWAFLSVIVANRASA